MALCIRDHSGLQNEFQHNQGYTEGPCLEKKIHLTIVEQGVTCALQSVVTPTLIVTIVMVTITFCWTEFVITLKCLADYLIFPSPVLWGN